MHREIDILNWASERNLIGYKGKATRHGQVQKTLEEAVELLEGINKDNDDMIKDAIGDIYVTLVIQAAMNGFVMRECVDAAFNEINKRKGKMINGVFVKEK